MVFILLFVWTPIIGILLLNFISNMKQLDRTDIYGEYIIDRTKFAGKQADWQYNHFRFKITEGDSIFFYETIQEKIIQTNKGTIRFHPSYKKTPRLIINIKKPRHHIIEDKPTLYRKGKSFYYVFKSPKFYNVFFKKGKWKPIEE